MKGNRASSQEIYSRIFQNSKNKRSSITTTTDALAMNKQISKLPSFSASSPNDSSPSLIRSSVETYQDDVTSQHQGALPLLPSNDTNTLSTMTQELKFCSPPPSVESFFKSQNQSTPSPSPTKRSKIVYDEIAEIKSETFTGYATVQGKVFDKGYSPERNGFIARIANGDRYIDLILPTKNDADCLIINQSYSFVNIKALKNGLFIKEKSSGMTPLRRVQITVDNVPHLNEQNSANDSPTIANIILKATNDVKTGIKHPKATLCGIITAVEEIKAVATNIPDRILTVYTKEGETIRIKLWNSAGFNISLQEKKAYAFRNFNVKLETENYLASTSSSTIVELNDLEFSLPEQYGYAFVVNVNLGSLKIYRMCGTPTCHRATVKKDTGICPTCNNYIPDEKCFAGFFLEVFLSDDEKEETGELVKLFDSSVQFLKDLTNIKYKEACDKGATFYESQLYGKLWKVKGEYGAIKPHELPTYNIKENVHFVSKVLWDFMKPRKY